MLGIRQKVPLLLHQLPGHIHLSRIAINVCSLFTKTGKWEEKFTKDVRIELESFWKDKVFARCRQDTVHASNSVGFRMLVLCMSKLLWLCDSRKIFDDVEEFSEG